MGTIENVKEMAILTWVERFFAAKMCKKCTRSQF